MSQEGDGPGPGAATPPGDHAQAPGEAPRVRPGLAWERRAQLRPGVAMLATVRQVVFSPDVAFASMRTEGGWAEPLGFAVVVGSISIWMAQAWDMLVRSLLVGLPGFAVDDIAAANVRELWFALVAPLIVVASTVIVAAIVHVLLIMLGGAPRPYEVTFRVICYSWAVGAFNLLPICGVFVGAVWRIVVEIIGVREAQEVPTGRAAAAVLIPVIVACFCLALVFIATMGAAELARMGIS